MSLRLYFERLEPRWMLAGEGPAMATFAAGSIQGHVYASSPAEFGDPPAGTPIVGARVELLGPTGELIESAITQSDGRFVFTQLAEGYFGLRGVQPTGYVDGIARAGSGGGSVVTSNLIIDIPLSGGAQLVGYTFWETPHPPEPGTPPSSERPVFQMFTGRIEPLAGQMPKATAPAGAMKLQDALRRTAPSMLGETFRLLQLREPAAPLRKSGFEGGCGKLIEDDSADDGTDKLPSTDPFEGLWDLAGFDPDADASDATSDDRPTPSDKYHTEFAARTAAIEQLAFDLAPGGQLAAERAAESQATDGRAIAATTN